MTAQPAPLLATGRGKLLLLLLCAVQFLDVVDSSTLATGLLASIEGGMVLSQARKDAASLRIAVAAGIGQVRACLG